MPAVTGTYATPSHLPTPSSFNPCTLQFEPRGLDFWGFDPRSAPSAVASAAGLRGISASNFEKVTAHACLRFKHLWVWVQEFGVQEVGAKELTSLQLLFEKACDLGLSVLSHGRSVHIHPHSQHVVLWHSRQSFTTGEQPI